jgi:hypothetical protein
MATAPGAIAAVVQAECAHLSDEYHPIVDAVHDLREEVVPYRLPSLSVVEFEVDYVELIETLKNKTDLTRVSVRKTTVIFSAASDRFDVWQLPPLSATLLNFCDGRRTTRDITRDLRSIGIGLSGIPPEKICFYGLMQLKKDGFIGLSASQMTWQKQNEDELLTRAPRYTLPSQANNTQQPWPAQPGSFVTP